MTNTAVKEAPDAAPLFVADSVSRPHNFAFCTGDANALRDLGDRRFMVVEKPPTPVQVQRVREFLTISDSTFDVTDEEVAELVADLVGDVTREPVLYLMETDSGAVSQTHYKHVAEEFARRPEYTVTPIYPRRAKPC